MKIKRMVKKTKIGYKNVFDISMRLSPSKFNLKENHFIVNGTVVHNCHAGGFVVSSDNLNDIIPIIRANKDYVTGWQESGAIKELEALGVIKIDILGLSCVEQIRLCVEEINHKYPKNNLPKDIYLLPQDDPRVYKFINTLQLDNIFQMESKVFVEAVRKIKPQSLQDISNISTLIRPGAAEVDDYVMAPLERREPKCLHNIYNDTRGLMIYQEQLLQVPMELADFSIFEADQLRRLVRKIGKAKTSDTNRQAMLKECEKYQSIYMDAAVPKIMREDGWDIKEATKYADAQWKQMLLQAKYCFPEDEIITLANGKKKKIKNIEIGDEVLAYTNNEIKPIPIVQKHDNGYQECYEFTTDKGNTIRCTGDHKFMTKEGLLPLLEIVKKDLEILEPDDM